MSKFARRGYRTGVFIDAANAYAACRDAYGKLPDYSVILKEAIVDNRLWRAIAYCVRQDDALDRWKRSVGKFGIEFKEVVPVRFPDGTVKADTDTLLFCDVWRLINDIDMIVLVTGDGDFVPLVERCQALGKVVRVISVRQTANHRLIEVAYEFVELTEALTFGSAQRNRKFGTSMRDKVKEAQKQ